MSELDDACGPGDVACISDLLDFTCVSCDVTHVSELLDNMSISRTDMTDVLHTAISYNHSDIITLLIKHGADVNYIRSNNRNSLHYALCDPTSTPEIVKLLLDTGVNADLTDCEGNTPLHILLYGIPNTKSRNKFGELITIMQLLFDYGASATIRNNDGLTALDLAAGPDGSGYLVELLQSYIASSGIKNAARCK